MDSIARPTDVPAQAADATVRQLQRLLSNAVRQRDALVAKGFDHWPDIDRHWFVPAADGFCQACNLPVHNRRHAARPA